MNKSSRMLILVASVVAAAMLAAGVMSKFTSGDSWLAYLGWAIFFLSLQVPFLLTQSSRENRCTAWLGRLMGKGVKP